MLLKEEKRPDPRTLRTRQALQTAFRALMTEKSLHEITVGDVTERATVNRATFYAHYEDKYDLIADIIRAMFTETLDRRFPGPPRVTDDNVYCLILAVCEFEQQIRGSCTPAKREFAPLVEREVKAQVYAVLLGWLGAQPRAQAGTAPPRELVASIASWAIYGAAAQWMAEGYPQPKEEFVRQVLPLIMGLLTRHG